MLSVYLQIPNFTVTVIAHFIDNRFKNRKGITPSFSVPRWIEAAMQKKNVVCGMGYERDYFFYQKIKYSLGIKKGGLHLGTSEM